MPPDEQGKVCPIVDVELPGLKLRLHRGHHALRPSRVEPQMSVGTDSTIAPLFAVGIGHLATLDSSDYLDVVGIMAVIVGVFSGPDRHTSPGGDRGVEFARNHIAFGIARSGDHLRQCMRRSGLLARIGDDRFFRSVEEAVVALCSINPGP